MPFGGGTRLAPTLAALVNGTAGHALDFDDIGIGAGHVSVAIMPAMFAVAEHVGAGGAAFLDALVLGYEVARRLTTMYSDTRLGPYAAGYHKPSVYSVFGGTAGANFGTMTKPMHAGVVGRSAVEAALLAASGFTASTEILEQRFGWHDVICRGEGDLPSVLDGLGETFAVEEGLVFKAYPCCGANHYAIDAVLTLMRSDGLAAADVASVEVEIEARNLQEVLVYPWPRTALEGKFSLAYNVAAVLADGAGTVETFTDAALARLTPVRDRVQAQAVTDLPQNGARATIRTTDGRTLHREQLIGKGSLADPLTWAELEAKFRANVAGRVSAEAASEVLARVVALENQPTLHALTEPLLG